MELENLISVRKIQQETISPGMGSPNHVLYLSELDLTLLQYTSTISVYEFDRERGGTKNPAKVVKDALAKSLVYYYPLAGRLMESNDGDGGLDVHCNGEGVIFVEAQANCTLEDVSFLNQPYNPSKGTALLLHMDSSQPIHTIPLFSVQVTVFKCGGFVIGINLFHMLMDGGGLAKFMESLGEICNKGVITSPVVWERELLRPRQPPRTERTPYIRESVPFHVFTEGHKSEKPMSCNTFKFSLDFLKNLKKSVVAESNGELSYCSTFEAVSALVWRTYAEILEFQRDVMGFNFIMNVRHVMFPGGGYYGNCVVEMGVKQQDLDRLMKLRKGQNIAGLYPMGDIVKCLRDAKERVGEEYVRATIDCLHAKRKAGGSRVVSGMLLPQFIQFNDWGRFEWTPDIGVGKGAGVTIPHGIGHPYVTILPKSRRSAHGIEVFVALPPDVMPTFKIRVANMVAEYSRNDPRPETQKLNVSRRSNL